MAKHTQTICQQFATICLSVFDHFVGLVLKGLKTKYLMLNYANLQSYKTELTDTIHLSINTYFKLLGGKLNSSTTLSKTY